jgi:hypothetical protein
MKHLAQMEVYGRCEDITKFKAKPDKEKVILADTRDYKKVLIDAEKAKSLKLPFIAIYQNVGITKSENQRGTDNVRPAIIFETSALNDACETDLRIESANVLLNYSIMAFATSKEGIQQIGLSLMRHLTAHKIIDIPYKIHYEFDDSGTMISKTVTTNIQSEIQEPRDIGYDGQEMDLDGEISGKQKIFSIQMAYDIDTPLLFSDQVEIVSEDVEVQQPQSM